MFLYNRFNTYHLKEKEYKEEEGTIREILSNNGFPAHAQTTLPQTTHYHTSQRNKHCHT